MVSLEFGKKVKIAKLKIKASIIIKNRQTTVRIGREDWQGVI